MHLRSWTWWLTWTSWLGRPRVAAVKCDGAQVGGDHRLRPWDRLGEEARRVQHLGLRSLLKAPKGFDSSPGRYVVVKVQSRFHSNTLEASMGVFNLECVLIGVAFILLWALHWTRWAIVAPAITGEDGMPRLLWRYTLGVGAILAIFLLWAALLPVRAISPWRAAAFLVADVGAAAVGTVLPRVFEVIHEAKVLQEDKADLGQALEARKRDA